MAISEWRPPVTVSIRPPAPGDWTTTKGTITVSGETVTITGAAGLITCKITDLVPGMKLRLRITVSASGPSPLIFAGNTATPVTAKYQTSIINVTSDGTLDLSITGATTVTVYKVEILADTDIADDATPAQVLSLHVLFPIRGVTGFRLDRSRLGLDALTRGIAPPEAFTLNRDRLNARRLFAQAANSAWQDITAPVTSLQITRGISATGPVYAAQAGVLTFSALDALDPRETGLTYGSPVTLIHWPSRTRLFTGTVTGIELTRQPPGSEHSYTVIYTVSDAVKRIASIKRYGARSEGGDGTETWNDRIIRLMRSAPEISYRIASTTYQRMCPTVWETSLAKHLDAATASVTGSWTCNRDNTITISAARPGASALIFSDVKPSNGTDIFAYTAVETSWATDDIVSAVDATNHAASIQDGEWRAQDETITISEETYAQTWAGTAVSVDLTCATTDAARSAARALIDKASDTLTPQSVTIRPAHAYGPANSTRLMALAASLDPLTPARVENRSDVHRVIITQIAHQITPGDWQTKVSFSPQR